MADQLLGLIFQLHLFLLIKFLQIVIESLLVGLLLSFTLRNELRLELCLICHAISVVFMDVLHVVILALLERKASRAQTRCSLIEVVPVCGSPSRSSHIDAPRNSRYEASSTSSSRFATLDF